MEAERFENYSELQYSQLTRKRIYPYEYMSSWDKFEESQLPPIEAFSSSLNMFNVSEGDYEHGQRVWKEVRIHNLGEYHIDIGVIAKNKEDYITFSVNVAVDKYINKEDNEKDKLIEL